LGNVKDFKMSYILCDFTVYNTIQLDLYFGQ